ncbi:pyridoxamine 5'-phosphate oxidase family protein [Clostridium sp. LP20]|uniref:pyridoxamine 5'-phosphate oxidase family protein n=1 Tax=Clostridium sp. LP20 TaxID=3418665 RepID=UPI003EE7DCB5
MGINNKIGLNKDNNELIDKEACKIEKVFCKKSYYITLDGEGDSNLSGRYKEGIDVLYTVAYALKNHYKLNNKDFLISNLNVLWWVNDNRDFKDESQEEWKWRLMMEMPSFISEDIFEEKRKEIFNKNNMNIINEVLQREMNEGISFQVEHVGLYKKKEKILEMNDRINTEGYVPRGFYHEIYLDNPTEVDKKNLKIIIRQPAFKEVEDKLDFNKVKEEFFRSIGDTKIMVLATTDSQKVSARNMSIVINNEKFYFQTDYNFDKCREIEKNKNVALCVDNIQIEGKVTYIGDFYDKKFEEFKKVFKLKHKSSYEGYSKLMDNKVFEVIPTKISLYKYDGLDVYREFIDFIKRSAYRRYYLRN